MLLVSFIFAYLIGSIPFGLLITRMMGYDIRAVGSGNIGATNVARSGRPMLALATLLFDGAKGAAAILIAYILNPDQQAFAPLCGFIAILGHVFPVWLKFKGGKGVATAIGVMLAINLQLGLIVCGVWLFVFYMTRYSSLAALMSIGWSSAIAYALGDMFMALMCLCIAALITYTHHANITRLLSGREMAFGKK